MRNRFHRRLALVAAVSVSVGVHAATQGDLSTISSQASFTATAQGPALARQVQILNVSDVTITNSTHPENNAGVVGVSMPFCIVDTYVGAVNLTMTTSNPLGGFNKWVLKSGDGSGVTYVLDLTYADLTGSFTPGGSLTSSSVTNLVPAGKAVASSGACGSGNFKVHFKVYDSGGFNPAPLPETLPAKTYTDTITMVVTPQ